MDEDFPADGNGPEDSPNGEADPSQIDGDGVSTPLLLALMAWIVSVVGECIALALPYVIPAAPKLPANAHLLLLTFMALSWWTSRRVDKESLRRMKMRGGKFQLTTRQSVLVAALLIGFTIFGMAMLDLFR